jgi:hypothetical protein
MALWCLNERDPNDYFFDLVEQIRRYAAGEQGEELDYSGYALCEVGYFDHITSAHAPTGMRRSHWKAA